MATVTGTCALRVVDRAVLSAVYRDAIVISIARMRVEAMTIEEIRLARESAHRVLMTIEDLQDELAACDVDTDAFGRMLNLYVSKCTELIQWSDNHESWCCECCCCSNDPILDPEIEHYAGDGATDALERYVRKECFYDTAAEGYMQ
jgi:hypothetical protein